MKHDATHEGLLEQAMAGAARADTLQGCPECQRKLAELRQLEAELLADAAQERALLEESRAGATAADEEAVSQALERARRERARGQRSWRFRLLALALAAGFVAVLALRDKPGAKNSTLSPEVTLGGDFPVRITVSAGRYDSVAWDCELLPGESFELSFEELEGGAIGRNLRTVTGLTLANFAPPPELERTLPAALRVLVRVRDVQGLPRAQASATASRR